MAQRPCKAAGPIFTWRAIPGHVKEPRAPIDNSRLLKSGVTGQIRELLSMAVKLHRHYYR